MREEMRNVMPARVAAPAGVCGRLDRSVTVFWARCSACERHKAINHQWKLTYQGGVLIHALCAECADPGGLAMECGVWDGLSPVSWL